MASPLIHDLSRFLIWVQVKNNGELQIVFLSMHLIKLCTAIEPIYRLDLPGYSSLGSGQSKRVELRRECSRIKVPF